MENKYSDIIDVTPQILRCLIGACPAIYSATRDVTPQILRCLIGSCPAIYESKQDDKNVYLIVGKQINPSDAGLEKKVGEGEVLVEVPRALIDRRSK